ncbi:hypothetical protein CL634_04445 [bacterium]|nr:hypothetical protein [bacterium]|tara:strand:+ start:214 stop:630 length:417 start_codon:yes stop_codon:yes gene_type:complete
MFIKKLKNILPVFFALTILLSPALALADTGQPVDEEIRNQLDVVGHDVFGTTSSTARDFHLAETVARVLKIVLSFLGVVFLALVIYGGLLWMTSAGNEDSVTKAKKVLTAAIIGIIIVLASFAITNFVVNQLTEAVVR